MAGEEAAYDEQLKVLMIGDSGKLIRRITHAESRSEYAENPRTPSHLAYTIRRGRKDVFAP